MKIDLKAKPGDEPKPCESPKEYYPCFYVSNNPKFHNIPKEGTAIITYKKVSETDSNRGGKETYSCDIEVRSFEPTGKAPAKKTKSAEESVDENMNAAEEEAEEY